MIDWKAVCSIGLKVLCGVIAGVAVFAGIESSTKTEVRKEEKKCDEGEEPKQQNNVTTNGDLVVRGARATQDTCGKLFAFTQSLTGVVESAVSLFSRNSGVGYQPYYGYGSGPWYQQPPVQYGTPTTWTRVSPFIVEAGCSNPAQTMGTQGRYPF